MITCHLKQNGKRWQKLLNSTSPTALCVRRNEYIQEPQVLL